MQRSSRPLTFSCPLVNPDHARFADVDGTLPTTDCAVCGISTQLTDSDPRAGHVRGEIAFGPAIYSASNTTGVTEYRLYFVDAAGDKLGSPLAVVPEVPQRTMPDCCASRLHTAQVQTALPALPPGQDTLRIAIIPVVGDLELPRGSATSSVQDLVGSSAFDLEAYTTTTALTTLPPLVAFAGVLVLQTASVQGLISDVAAQAAIGRGLSRASGVRSAQVQFSSFTGQPDANLATFSYRLIVKERGEVAQAASTLSDLSIGELQVFVGIELEAVRKESYALEVISNGASTTVTSTGLVPHSFPQDNGQGALANVGVIVVACLVVLCCACILLIACVVQNALHHHAKAAKKQRKVLPIQPIDVVGYPENNSPGDDRGALKFNAIVPQPMGQLHEETMMPPIGPVFGDKLAAPLEEHVKKERDKEDAYLPPDVPDVAQKLRQQKQQNQHEGPRAAGRHRPPPCLFETGMHDERQELADSFGDEVPLQRPSAPPQYAPPPTWAPVSLAGGNCDHGSSAEDDLHDSLGVGNNGLVGIAPFASTWQLDEELRTRHRRATGTGGGGGLGASVGSLSTTASSPTRLRVIRTSSQRSETPEDASIFSCTGSTLTSARQSPQPRGTYDIHELAEFKQLPGRMSMANGERDTGRKAQLKRPASAASTLQHRTRPASATSSTGNSQGVSRMAGRKLRPTSAAGALTVGSSLMWRDADQCCSVGQTISDGGGNDRGSPQPPWLSSLPASRHVSKTSGRPSTVVEGCDDWSSIEAE